MNGLTIQSSDSDPTVPLQVGKSSNDPAQAGNYLKILKDGNVGIGTNDPKHKLEVVGGAIQLDGNQQIVFTNEDTSNQLKVQLWNGFGLGINSNTLFYTGNVHSWRDSANNERMTLDSNSIGGLTVKGTGASSFAGNVGIGVGATGPQAKLDVNGDVIVRGVIKGSYSDPNQPNRMAQIHGADSTYVEGLLRQNNVSTNAFPYAHVGNQNATIIQGFAATTSGDTRMNQPHSFALGYAGGGTWQNSALIIDLTTGALSGLHKSFVIDHPLHEDKYLMHATLEGPEGGIFYRGTADCTMARRRSSCLPISRRWRMWRAEPFS